MFRGNAKYLKIKLEIGMKINIEGNITVYTPRGNYQLLCSKIQPSGVGELALAYEQLKVKLQAKGYFEQSHKKIIPIYPKILYIITSNTGAAIEDMKKISKNRWPLVKICLLPTIVQGIDAKLSIVESINKADNLAQKKDEKSIIIVGRGGGSIEDLWSFNEEIVADAIYNCKTPIISAVGHENDFLISDFVADQRASTPSNAIEISLPHINEQTLYIQDLKNNLKQKQEYIISKKSSLLDNLKKSFGQHSLKNKFSFLDKSIESLTFNFNQYIKQLITQKQLNLDLLKQNYKINNPDDKNFGYYVQLSKNNKPVDIINIKKDDTINLQSNIIDVTAKVTSVKKIIK